MKTARHNHVLMIDDDESLLGIMSIKLEHSGYKVDTAAKSSMGYDLALSQPYDALIVDLIMPGLNGMEICKSLRAEGVLTPILMLSGNTEKVTIVESLELGADDYLTKPFSHTELVARLRALVRRNRKTFHARWVEKEGVSLDTHNNRIGFGDKTINLTRKEALLLKRLMCESPEPVDREQLLNDVWEIDNHHTSNRLDVYIRRLRAKLAEIGADNLIHTRRGSGYNFGRQ
ncbi:MAG: response regulator transcription factor [Candidatus Saccharibacteria bacterium]|nr:response regulator transcription factor [Candidatus Saccharibacteria bacterium]